MDKEFNISVRFHETGAVSIDHIRYGPSTEIARFFADWRARKRPTSEVLDIHEYRKLFPNGTVVTHTLGGRGKIKTLENDWSTDPPTVIALVEVVGTMFPRIREIPVTELQPEIAKETLENWKKEAVGFSKDIKDIKDMREAEPVFELISRFLSVIQELQEKNR